MAGMTRAAEWQSTVAMAPRTQEAEPFCKERIAMEEDELEKAISGQPPAGLHSVSLSMSSQGMPAL